MVAPGRQKELFQVESVSYTTEKTGEEKQPEHLRHEYPLQDFSRRFKLDIEVINDESIKVTYTDGILRLSLPNREQAVKSPRQIAVA